MLQHYKSMVHNRWFCRSLIGESCNCDSRNNYRVYIDEWTQFEITRYKVMKKAGIRYKHCACCYTYIGLYKPKAICNKCERKYCKAIAKSCMNQVIEWVDNAGLY